MSTLWTPDGERPVRRSDPTPPPPAPADATGDGGEELTDEEMAARMAELMATTPAEVVVAQHAFDLFQLAALHLSLQPPQFDQARIAIDACGALIEGMQGRLGEPEGQLVEGLAQLRLAFVEISAAARRQP